MEKRLDLLPLLVKYLTLDIVVANVEEVSLSSLRESERE
jgi:hypothetical protein